MTVPRAPWWMYLVAASYLSFFAFTIYADYTGPEGAGIDAYDFDGGSLHLGRLEAGSALERAGVRTGDRIIAIDGDWIRTQDDWRRHRVLFVPGAPIDLEVIHEGATVHRTLALNRADPFESLGGRLSYIAWRGGMLTFLLLSGFVFLRPDDLSARLGSLTLATFTAAVAIINPSYGWSAAWRSLPGWLAAVFLIPAAATAVSPAIMLSLFAVFPRPFFRSTRTLRLCWAPVIVLALLLVHLFWPMYDTPGFLRPWDETLRGIWVALLIVYAVAAYTLLAVHYRRLTDQNDRRRVRSIVPPTVAFWIVALHTLTVLNWPDYIGTTPPLAFSLDSVAIDGLLIQMFPIGIAYAILKHRLFNVSVVIRQGLQYALARRVVVSVLPAAALVLIADIGIHRDLTIGAVLSARGGFYAVVAAFALVAQHRQHAWLDALDRRFFRERYNAQQILREVAEEIRRASLIEQVAGRVVMRIDAALHPEFSAVLVRAAQESSYHALACVPPGLAPPLMHADSKLVGLLRLLGKPVQISTVESGWLQQQLPHEDTDFLKRARIDLLVPISVSAFGREAILVLGQKKSEEPYGGEDQALLLAIASALALLLERPTTATLSGLEECPACGSCFDSGVGRCTVDESRLTASAVPRVLSGRYRLDRRLGRGGMGTVYSAFDATLDRQVALKLIRDDLIASTEAAERFRREARAAAAVTHANIVTLFDFSVDADHRAFLVMELLSGVTLRQRLRQSERVPTSDVRTILRGVCSALTLAHQRGLIHRDLKPENIFLVEEPDRVVPKILDFGVAKFVASSEAMTEATVGTGAGVLVGTPRYMSPEQLQGTPASPQWDVWALAVMTYEMVAGAHPFGDAESVAALHSSILSGRLTPIARHRPDAPASWQTFFIRGLATNAADRPASAVEFLQDCERALV